MANHEQWIHAEEGKVKAEFHPPFFMEDRAEFESATSESEARRSIQLKLTVHI